MFSRRILFIFALATASIGVCHTQAQAHDRVRARITSAPTFAHVGGAIRVISVVKNFGPEPQRVSVAIWLVRPWGQQVKLGETEITLRPGESQVVGVPGSVPQSVIPGPHSLGLVIGTQSGRAIADTSLIRILPACVSLAE